MTDPVPSDPGGEPSAAHRRFLHELDEALRALDGPDAMLREASHRLGRRLAVARVGYVEHDAAGEVVIMRPHFVDGVPALDGPYRLADYGADLASALHAGHTHAIADVARDERLDGAQRAGFAALAIGATVNVPFLREGRLAAIFYVHDRHARRWSTDEVALIEAVARRTRDAMLWAQAADDQREIDRRYRTMFDAIEQGVCVVEVAFDHAGRAVDYRMVDVNAKFAGQTGMDLRPGQWVREAVPGLEEFWFETYGRVAATGESTRFVHRAEPMGRWFDVHAFRIGDPRERLVGILFDDITARVLADQERERLVAALRDADARKDEFLAMLAHELRNPLAPVVNAHRLLARTESLGEQGARLLAMAQRQTHQLERIVDDLLEVSRISRGRVELRQEPMSLGVALREAVEARRADAEASGLRLTLGLPASDATLHADPVRIAQVFGNLLDNALKYTPRGGTVRVTAEVDPAHAVVRVVDDGIGIAPEHLRRLFELFSQIDTTLDRARGGLGIGLALVRTLVEMHGGSVRAHSEGPGRGSTFEVRLPRTGIDGAPGRPPGS